MPGHNRMQVLHTASFEHTAAGIAALQQALPAADEKKPVLHVSITDVHAVQVPYAWRNAAEHVYRETAPITQHLLQAPVAAWQVVQAYAAPAHLHQWLDQCFEEVHYHSAPALALTTYNGFSERVQLILLISGRHFTVVLKGESGLQLCQTYCYTAPLDVVYYLLKIKEQYHLPDAVQVVAGGEAINEGPLLEQVSTYFPNTQLAVPPHWEIAGFDGNGPQLFHLLNLAACVS